MRIAMIKDGIIQNIALWDGIAEWKPAGYELIDISNRLEVDIGWAYDGQSFQPPSQDQEV